MTNPQPTSFSMVKKLKPLPLKSGTRMPALITIIQHTFGSFSHSSQRGKEMKGIQIGKEEVKLSLFADDMILYIENPKDAISLRGKHRQNTL